MDIDYAKNLQTHHRKRCKRRVMEQQEPSSETKSPFMTDPKQNMIKEG